MPTFKYDKERIRSGIHRLDHRSQVAFVLSCAERMLPNYAAFQRETGWGDFQSPRLALDIGWKWLAGETEATSGIALVRGACDAAAPDTEDFDTILVSAALDAASAACLLLDLLAVADDEKTIEVSTLARDTVDMYVQETEQMQSNAPDLEERIRSHPLMQSEIMRQYSDLQILGIPWTDEELKERWRSPTKSNLGLT